MHTHLFSLLLLLGLTSANPTPTDPNAALSPRALPRTGSWPSPIPPAHSPIYYPRSWPPNVLPLRATGADFTTGPIPTFIIQRANDNEARVPRPVVIYAVIRANPADKEGVVAQTLGLELREYRSLGEGWASEGQGSFYEVWRLGFRAEIVAWRWIGVSTGLGVAAEAMYAVDGLVGSGGGRRERFFAGDISAGELQRAGAEWFALACAALRRVDGVFMLD
ncbi:MAG: hypothetical protein M1829_002254 [Trizodia sp. TS-e1964]|nr:MAG: hypothetical protein M1829_002254 [Trizodia sp. TS-e1964]